MLGSVKEMLPRMKRTHLVFPVGSSDGPLEGGSNYYSTSSRRTRCTVPLGDVLFEQSLEYINIRRELHAGVASPARLYRSVWCLVLPSYILPGLAARPAVCLTPLQLVLM